MSALAEQVLAGNRRALARALTCVENQQPDAQALLRALYPHGGNAHVIGVTGAPGTGKSTLVSRLVSFFRTEGKRVAVLAVDPTSPFSGGAILGDRVRMQEHATDAQVFIRSMASRGSLGGLALMSLEAVRVLDAAGFDVVLVETVGAGQSEVEIVHLAQTVLVVESPGLGDGVQAIKAGILEIADVLVVNKADLPSVHQTVRALQMMVELGHPTKRATQGHHGVASLPPMPPEIAAPSDAPLWIPPIIETVAADNIGIVALGQAIAAHHRFMQAQGLLGQQHRALVASEFKQRLMLALLNDLYTRVPASTLEALLNEVAARKRTPSEAVEIALQSYRYHPHPAATHQG